MRNIAVRKNYSIDLVLGNELFKIAFIANRYACGVQGTGQLRRVTPISNIRNLCRRESDDSKLLIVAKYNIEVMEISPGSTQNDEFFHIHGPRGRQVLTKYSGIGTITEAVSVITSRGDA